MRAALLAAIATAGGLAAVPAAQASGPLLLTKLPINLTTQDALQGDNLTEAKSVRIGATTYFTAQNGNQRGQVWKTDGTEAGTALVKDFFPDDSTVQPDLRLAKAGSNLTVMVGYNASNVSVVDLWITDGAGPLVQVPAPGGSTWGSIEKPVTAADGTSYFVAALSGANPRLWSLDPSDPSSLARADDRLNGLYEQAPVVVGGNVYYLHWNEGDNDGTLSTIGAGHAPIDALDANDQPVLALGEVIVASGDGRVFFRTLNALQTYDTATKQVGTVTLNGNPVSVNLDYTQNVPTPTGVVSIGAGYDVHPMIMIDGNAATIQDFGAINRDAFGAPQRVGGRIYQRLYDQGVGANRLYQQDNVTLPGMSEVVDVDENAMSPLTAVVSLAGHDYILGRNQAGVTTLFEIVAGNAQPVQSFPDADGGSSLTSTGGELVFELTTAASGDEPWVSDGTPNGARLLKDVNDARQASDPGISLEFAGKAWFQARDGVHGAELWNTDGTPGGTHLFKDMNPGASDSSATPLLVAGGKLYFSAHAGGKGEAALFVTDGTADGTTQLTGLDGDAGARPSDMVVVGSTIYFRAIDPQRYGLWKTDGTPGGTVSVDLPVPQGETRDTVTAPVVAGGKVFVASATVSGAHLQLWVISGADAPTEVLQTDHLAYFVGVERISAFGDGVALIGADVNHQNKELIKSDGTVSGTTRLNTPAGNDIAASGHAIVQAGAGALYRGSNNTLAILTPSGGFTLVNVPGGTVGADPFVASDGRAYVVSSGGPRTVRASGRVINAGASVYVVNTDGTTTLLGTYSSVETSNVFNPYAFREAHGLVYFAARTSPEGRQLFETDGTSAGTKVALDRDPGAANSVAEFIGAVGAARLFGDDDVQAKQLFALAPEVTPTPTPAATPTPSPEASPTPTPAATPAPAASPTPAPVGPPAPTKLRPVELRTTAKNKGGGQFQISGTIALPSLPASVNCDGSVRLVVKIGHKPKTLATTKLRVASKGRNACTFSKTITVPTRAGLTQRVRVIFDGDEMLYPVRGRSTALPHA